MISRLNNYSIMQHTYGGVNRNRSGRLYVGRDIGRMSSSAEKPKDTSVVLSEAANNIKEAKNSFSRAETSARLGFMLKDDILNGEASAQFLASGSSEEVYLTYTGGKAQLLIKSISGEAADKYLDLTKDTRVSWSEDGKALVQTGAEATSGGKLKAEGANELLFRFSAVDVEAGAGTKVVNFSKQSGSFSGGSNVTYLGAYGQNDKIAAGDGATEFGGYFYNTGISSKPGGQADFSGVFEGSVTDTGRKSLDGGSGQDKFSGFFKNMNIDAGEGDNMLTGLFIGISVASGNGKDSYSGKFIESVINAAGGDNHFGSAINYTGTVQASFIDTILESGDGKDTFSGFAQGGTFNFGQGADNVNGVFMDSLVDTGEGNDTLTALYARNTLFETGLGDDGVNIITGSTVNLDVGDGNNTVTSGINRNKADAQNSAGKFDGTTWITEGELEAGLKAKYGDMTGEVINLNVKADQGTNAITVNDGKNTHNVSTGIKKTEDAEEAADESTLPAGQALPASEALADTPIIANELLEALSQPVSPQAAAERYMNVQRGGILSHKGRTSVTIDGGTDETVSFALHDRFAFKGAPANKNALHRLVSEYGKSRFANI